MNAISRLLNRVNLIFTESMPIILSESYVSLIAVKIEVILCT